MEIEEQVVAGAKGRNDRFWSAEEKRSICLQTTVPEVSVVQVARRYSMNPSLIFKWLKDPRFAPQAPADGPADEDASEVEDAFHAVEVTQPAAGSGAGEPQADCGSGLSACRVDITLSDGRRILVEGRTTLSSVLILVTGLMA